MSKRGSSVGQWFLAIVVVAGALAGGIYLYQRALQPPSAVPVAAVEAPAPPAGAPVAPIAHPLPAAAATLADGAPGDGSTVGDLTALAGDADLASLLIPDDVVAHIVATVDALPRHGMATRILPVHTPKGPFVVDEGGDGTVLGARNAARYATYMDVVENLSAPAVVRWYVAHYASFQQAYRDLGYPDGYFNDRLVFVIDDLLATPDVAGNVALVQERMHYDFVDPSLQSLSVGQKMLVRSGAVNEARVKAKLTELRQALMAQQVGAAH